MRGPREVTLLNSLRSATEILQPNSVKAACEAAGLMPCPILHVIRRNGLVMRAEAHLHVAAHGLALGIFGLLPLLLRLDLPRLACRKLRRRCCCCLSGVLAFLAVLVCSAARFVKRVCPSMLRVETYPKLAAATVM